MVGNGVDEILLRQRALIRAASHPRGHAALMLNFMRPTREKSYLRWSKNIPWNNCVAVSTVGGSPGRSLR